MQLVSFNSRYWLLKINSHSWILCLHSFCSQVALFYMSCCSGQSNLQVDSPVRGALGDSVAAHDRTLVCLCPHRPTSPLHSPPLKAGWHYSSPPPSNHFHTSLPPLAATPSFYKCVTSQPPLSPHSRPLHQSKRLTLISLTYLQKAVEKCLISLDFWMSFLPPVCSKLLKWDF